MSRSNRISLLFFLIFLGGILGVVVYVNKTLNKKTVIEFSPTNDWAVLSKAQTFKYPS
jgi:hypothetical protein